ncbi:MAG: hypothetical protein ABIA97_04730 [Candidatus Omnitrophota bacterium]
MATALETLERRALRGVIRAIEPVDGTMSLICADIDKGNTPVATEMPVEEVQRLNLRIGDAIVAFPISCDTYLIIGKPN